MRNQRHKCALLGAVALAVFGIRVDAQIIPIPADGPVVMERERMVIALPLPRGDSKSARSGYYIWRITSDSPRPFSVVITTDTAVRFKDAASVLRVVSARRCEDPLVVSARECKLPITNRIEVGMDHFRVIIRDPELLRSIRREPVDSVWRYVVRPGGGFVLSRVAFEYR